MKNIWAITMVKNESDIIESFCRYTLCYSDGIIIQDDVSSDNTIDIIQNLINEGLNIILLRSEKKIISKEGYGKLQVINAMIKLAIEEHDADWVIPVDADEFLICADGSSPRRQLEELDESIEHQIKWRTYIYEKSPKDGNIFLPYNFKHFRNPKLERLYKTFISKEIFYNYDCTVALGNHSIIFSGSTRPPIDYPDNLLLAHYPIRNENQLLSKIIIGELNYLCVHERRGSGIHWHKIYEQIKKTGKLEKEQIKSFSLEYDSGELGIDYTQNDLTAEYGTFKTDFLQKNIILKYTEFNRDDYLNKILTHIENIFQAFKQKETDIHAGYAEKIHRIESYKNKIKINTEHIKELNDEIEAISSEMASCKQYISDIENSRSWKIARKISKTYLLFKKR